MPDPSKVYWDACVFLAWINNEDGRVQHLARLLDKARSGELEIWTSALSIVEVAFAQEEHRAGVLDPAAEARIDELWSSAFPIKLVEFYPGLAIESRALVRGAMAKGLPLKAADAIHLVTASGVGLTRVHTYDKPMTDLADLTGMVIEEPYVDDPYLPFGPPESSDTH